MKILLTMLCLIIALKPLEAQSGKYQIDTKDGRNKEGFITINPYTITIVEDSTLVAILPVIDVVEDHNKTYYLLEGCAGGTNFKGAATFYNREIKFSNGMAYGMSLYIELRTRQGYSFSRYGLFYAQ